MKIKFLATALAPEYSISGETITIDHDGETETLDLSGFPEGAIFEGVEFDSDMPAMFIRNVDRTSEDLFVTLCQMAPVSMITYVVDGEMIHKEPQDPEPETYSKKIEHRAGHWKESDWIDADDYNPETLYIQPNGES